MRIKFKIILEHQDILDAVAKYISEAAGEHKVNKNEIVITNNAGKITAVYEGVEEKGKFYKR